MCTYISTFVDNTNLLILYLFCFILHILYMCVYILCMNNLKLIFVRLRPAVWWGGQVSVLKSVGGGGGGGDNGVYYYSAKVFRWPRCTYAHSYWTAGHTRTLYYELFRHILYIHTHTHTQQHWRRVNRKSIIGWRFSRPSHSICCSCAWILILSYVFMHVKQALCDRLSVCVCMYIRVHICILI